MEGKNAEQLGAYLKTALPGLSEDALIILQDECITGSALLECSDQDLRTIGLKMGPIKMLRKLLQKELQKVQILEIMETTEVKIFQDTDRCSGPANTGKAFQRMNAFHIDPVTGAKFGDCPDGIELILLEKPDEGTSVSDGKLPGVMLQEIETRKQAEVQADEERMEEEVQEDQDRMRSESKKTLVPKGVQLPSIEGTRLQDFISNADVVQHLDEFTRAWTTDLCRLTKGRPLPSDYRNYAKSIVKKYPFLGKTVIKGTTSSESDEANHRAMAEKLSACVRRRRNYVKRLTEKSFKKGSKESWNKTERQQQTDKPSTSQSVTPETCGDQEEEQSLMVELKSNSNLKDIPHVKLLLSKTLGTRRKWIQDQSSSCADVLVEVPAFKNMDLVLYEAELYGWYTEEKCRTNLDIILSQLAGYFEKVSDNQIILLEELEKTLQPSKAPAKMLSRCFSVNKVFENPDCLISDEGESLRLVLFMDVREIKLAFVVGEGMQWEISNPSICKCLASLLASYYVFNRAYPDLYKNILLFLEVNFLGLHASDTFSPKLKKFVRKLNAAATE